MGRGSGGSGGGKGGGGRGGGRTREGTSGVDAAGAVDGGGVPVEELPLEDRAFVADYIGGYGEQDFDVFVPEDINMWGGGVANEYLNVPESYATLNAAQKITLERYSSGLENALNKVEDAPGKSYRVIDESYLSGISDIQTATKMGPITSQYEPGSVVTIKGFTSSSRVRNAQMFSFDDTRGAVNTRITLIGKHGKSVENVAGFYKGQREILHNRNTSFRILSREFNTEQQTWDVVMEEV